MGLDAYLYQIDPVYVDQLAMDRNVKCDIRFFKRLDGNETSGQAEELAYWRKEWPLHKFLHEAYIGCFENCPPLPEGEYFNCAYMRIWPELLERLEKFFPDCGYAWDEARKAMNAGYYVYYWSWY